MVADGEVVAVVRDGGRECAALEPEVTVDGDRLAAAPVAVGAADEHERRIAADVDRTVTHRQLHRLDVAQDAVAVLGHHDVDADRVAGVALGHTQHEGFRPCDLRHIDRVRQVIVSRFAVAAEILAVLRDEHALGEHGLRPAAVERVDQLHIGDVARCNRAEIVKAILTRGVERRHLDNLAAVEPGCDRLAHDVVDVADSEQILGVHVVRADGHEITPRLILAAVDQEGEVIDERACTEVDVHTGAELRAPLVGVHALMVGHRTADAVGRELTAEAVRRMALQEHAAAQALIDDGVHTLAVVHDADIVHDLGNADNVVHVEQFADLLGMKLRTGVFHPGQGRHARRGEHILAQLGLLRVFKHEAHAVEPHDVADLMRVGADGRRAPRQNGAGEVLGDHHRALDVHVRVNVAGDQIASLTIVVRPGRKDRLLALLTHQNDKSVQYVDTGRIDFSRNDIEKLYVADRQIARYLTQSRLHEARAILGLASTHQ